MQLIITSSYPGYVLLIVLLVQCSTAYEAPTHSEAWLWEKDVSLANTHFDFYLQHSGTYTELVLCVIQCLQIRDCQTFTVTTTGISYNCRFHKRRFSQSEASYLSTPMSGLDYFVINSNCPISDSHFFSREARLCISVNTVKTTRSVAEVYCKSIGGNLVIIDSDVKVAFVTTVMEEVNSWKSLPFHVNASAEYDMMYTWGNGAPVSVNLMDIPYDPANECMEVIYDGPRALLGQIYDCRMKLMSKICEFPL